MSPRRVTEIKNDVEYGNERTIITESRKSSRTPRRCSRGVTLKKELIVFELYIL